MKIYLIHISIFFYLYQIIISQCSNFDDFYKCNINENQYEFPETWDERNFQTPPRNDILGNYKPTYQDMHYLVGYAQLKYSSDRKSCNVIFYTRVNPKLGKQNEDYKINYKFGDIEQINNIFRVTSDDIYPEGLSISAEIVDMDNNHLVELILENEFFIWDHPEVNLPDDIYEKGQKGVIVELLGWPYDDIAEECEFLGHAGYLGVKIFSPNEHVLTYKSTLNGELNYLNYIYNPVSYKLESRMGNKYQLNNMINKCRKNGIRIYAELAINHMTTYGDDSYEKHIDSDCSTWGGKDGSAGSPFWTTKGLYKNNTYTRLLPVIEFPAVPYFANDFHCYSHIEFNEQSELKMENGYINDYIDLNTKKEYVQQRIADFLTELISIGISGFTFHSVVNISPSNYAIIYNKLKSNLGNIDFPDELLFLMQVEYRNNNYLKELFICNKDESNYYSFTKFFVDKMKDEGLSENDIQKVKLWNTGFFDRRGSAKPICNGEWAISQERYALGKINFYNQKPVGNDIYITQHNLEGHKNEYSEFLKDNSTNSKIKLYFSSYSNMNNGGIGFPDGKSDCQKCINEECKSTCTKSVPYQKAYNPLSVGYDAGDGEDWKEGTYTRVHRNIDIVNSMREWMKLDLFENEDELFKNERLKANCSKECLICNEESNNLGMCITCNIDEGYYPVFNRSIYERYYKCLHISNKGKYYLDEENKILKPCYDLCKTCEKEGNETFHNCLTCENNYAFREESLTIFRNNCFLNIICESNRPYYYSEDGEYKCSKIAQCPKEAHLLIKEKNKCIKDCKKDNTYKYQYNGNCLNTCPNNTYNNNFLCKENIIEKCTLSEIEIKLDNFYDNEAISTLAQGYSDEFSYTNNHISKFKYNNYDFIFYKNPNCISELSLNMPKFNFTDCYNKVKDYYSIKENLIIATNIKYLESGYSTSHSFFNPNNGQKLDAETICKNISITQEEDILNKFKENNIDCDLLLYLIKQDINIFNLSDPFYTDICFPFDSPINKDITLKDRLLTFYPNITLCESGCENKALNLTDMTALCKCKFNDIINNELIKDNIFINSITNEIVEIITQSNIEVLKCYKYIFKYFQKSIGGFISLFLIFIHIILTFIYYRIDLSKIKNYIFNLTSQYLLYLSNNNTNNHSISERNRLQNPTKKNKIKISKYNGRKSSNFNKKSIFQINNDNSSNFELNKKSNYSRNLNENINQNEQSLIYNKTKRKYSKDSKKKTIKKSSKKFQLNLNDNKMTEKLGYKNKNIDTNFDKYLEPSLDDLPYDDAIKKDKRKFCVFFCESIKEKQTIANIFFEKDPINTKTIKLMLLNLDIFLYFIVNGLFYNEDYISEVYNLKEKESFFSFLPRSLYRILYSTFVSLILNIIVDCFILNENKLKGIFRREKENEITLKSEVHNLVRKIAKNNLIFIIILFIFYIFFFYYILCFNYVYPNMQIEWIKSSITIIIIMNLLSFFSIFIETILRFMSFSCKSEKIYKASKLLNN